MTTTLNRRDPILPAEISRPAYDLTRVTPGIVHIGLGGFHRAHFARFTHDLMERDPDALSWGIIGAGLRASDASLLASLARQDGLYTLVERDRHGEKKSLIGSIVRTIDASFDRAELLDAMTSPKIRIVSITVSEHGYHLDGATRKLNGDDPAILRDIAGPRTPVTILGILVEAFRRRRDGGLPAFTALSCDNIQENGDVLREATLYLARSIDPALADWIAENGCFPNSMVDRITPVPSSTQIMEFQDSTGLADEAPIFAESFRQWVIEDRFCDARPAWNEVGAQFVENVTPYEKMKLRLLNASHLATAGLGVLAGYETVRETIEDPLIRQYMERLMASETGPTLSPVPGVDLAAYQRTLIDRFGNPAIHDRLQRVNADAPVNLLLDPLRDRLAADETIDLLCLGLAAWCRRVKVEAPEPIERRPMGKAELQLQELARADVAPISFLMVDAIFGNVGTHPRVVANVGRWLTQLSSDGAEATLRGAAHTGLL